MTDDILELKECSDLHDDEILQVIDQLRDQVKSQKTLDVVWRNFLTVSFKSTLYKNRRSRYLTYLASGTFFDDLSKCLKFLPTSSSSNSSSEMVLDLTGQMTCLEIFAQTFQCSQNCSLALHILGVSKMDTILRELSYITIYCSMYEGMDLSTRFISVYAIYISLLHRFGSYMISYESNNKEVLHGIRFSDHVVYIFSFLVEFKSVLPRFFKSATDFYPLFLQVLNMSAWMSFLSPEHPKIERFFENEFFSSFMDSCTFLFTLIQQMLFSKTSKKNLLALKKAEHGQNTRMPCVSMLFGKIPPNYLGPLPPECSKEHVNVFFEALLFPSILFDQDIPLHFQKKLHNYADESFKALLRMNVLTFWIGSFKSSDVILFLYQEMTKLPMWRNLLSEDMKSIRNLLEYGDICFVSNENQKLAKKAIDELKLQMREKNNVRILHSCINATHLTSHVDQCFNPSCTIPVKNATFIQSSEQNERLQFLEEDKVTAFARNISTAPKVILLLCTQCKLARYCCKKCQMEDWPKHKPWCKTTSQAKQQFTK